MKKLKISPSSLKAWFGCRRSWWLQFHKRAERIVPAYVTGGSALDAVVQSYLQGHVPALIDAATEAELEALVPELPAPGTVMVQHRFELPCPGLEDRAALTTGGLDYMTPPNLDLMVIGDLKRIWHKDAAMSEAQLADDIQSQLYAWFVWQVYAPAEIVWRWTYCVRETRNQTTGKVTRKAKAFSVDVKADRARVEAWFERVVLPAAREMLELIDAAEAAEAVEHNPDSCEEGARCFVRHHCPMYVGPIKGETQLVDLSRFRTGARPALAAELQGQVTPAVTDAAARVAAVVARPAINPPAPSAAEAASKPSQRERAEAALHAKDWPTLSLVLAEAQNEPPLGIADGSLPRDRWTQLRDVCNAAQSAEQAITVATVEGPGAELLEQVPDAPATEPAPPPEASIVPASPRKRRRAEKQAQRELDAHEAEVVNPPTVETATTEALLYELRERGYTITLELGR